MPTCEKDSRAYYSGKEPSPKGWGLCAHAEQVGTRAQGQDGDVWEVRADKRGTLSWKKMGALGAVRHTPQAASYAVPAAKKARSVVTSKKKSVSIKKKKTQGASKKKKKSTKGAASKKKSTKKSTKK